MPKSSKKRKDKAADFAKAKLKLGKGKQAASNVIDTSFKARSIALPSQSIAKPKDLAAPTTKRKLTFDDLIAHLKHYNAATRRDALLGLRELLDAHSELLETSLTSLINAVVRMIPDEDSSVRKTLLGFFAWLLPRIDPEDIIPHSSVILLFTTSAQTHIFPEIRIDAIKLLNILLEHVPKTVVDGWTRTDNTHGARVLEGYLGLLNAGTQFGGSEGPAQATSTASVVLTPASKLVVLQSLSTFLARASDSETITPLPAASSIATSVPTWYMTSAFRTRESYEAFKVLLESNTSLKTLHQWEEDVEQDDIFDFYPAQFSPALVDTTQDWTLHDLSSSGYRVHSHEDSHERSAEVKLIIRLAGALSSILVATFLDCAPAVFSPGQAPSEVELKTVLAVAQIVRGLYGSLLKSPLKGDATESVFVGLQTILGYMAGYFPFKTHGSRNIQMEESLQDLNIIFCEMTSLLSLAVSEQGSDRTHSRRRGRSMPNKTLSGNHATSLQIERIDGYISVLLRGESVDSGRLGKPITPEAYLALLPAIWALLNKPLQEHSNPLFEAVIDHSLRTSSKSAVKPLTIAFIARLVLLESDPHYEGNVRVSRERRIDDWVSHLPQVLWEFGTSNFAGSELVLKFLLRIFQRKTHFCSNQKVISSLQSKFVPYFCINHPTRGHVFGPFSKLPASSPLRRLVLDLMATLTAARGTSEVSNPLTAAIQESITDSPEADYWVHVSVHMKIS